MMGIHPSPSSTIRRTLRGVSVPEKSTGGPAGATGRGWHQMSANDTDPDEKVAGLVPQRARHAPIVSVRSWPRADASRPWASNSSCCQPVPTPSSRRPCDRTSSVAAVLASSVAGRSGAMRMPVQSRSAVVTAATAVSTVSGSGHGQSGACLNEPHG
jgi:hypothetical protein